MFILVALGTELREDLPSLHMCPLRNTRHPSPSLKRTVYKQFNKPHKLALQSIICSFTPSICSLSISFASLYSLKHSLKALNKMSNLFAHPQNECLLPSHKNNLTLLNTTWNDGWCERGMMLWTVFFMRENGSIFGLFGCTVPAASYVMF